MAGGLIQLTAYGAQNIYLIENPSITFFKKVYRKHSNFACENINVQFDKIPSFRKPDGRVINLRDVLDFRSVADSAGNFNTAGATVINCNFLNNSASEYGSHINSCGNNLISNCFFAGGNRHAIFQDCGSTSNYENCLIENSPDFRITNLSLSLYTIQIGNSLYVNVSTYGSALVDNVCPQFSHAANRDPSNCNFSTSSGYCGSGTNGYYSIAQQAKVDTNILNSPGEWYLNRINVYENFNSEKLIAEYVARCTGNYEVRYGESYRYNETDIPVLKVNVFE